MTAGLAISHRAVDHQRRGRQEGARRLLLVVLLPAAWAAACASGGGAPPGPSAGAASTGGRPPARAPDLIAVLERDLEAARRQADSHHVDLEQTTGRLVAVQAELASLQEGLSELEEARAEERRELERSVEELLYLRALARSIDDRAEATSRIAQVRVELSALGPDRAAGEAPGAEEIAAVEERLARADEALGREAVATAAFFAERASQSLEQFRLLQQVSSTLGSEVLRYPMSPPLELEVITNANLRRAPGTEQARIGGVEAGDRLQANARAGSWYRVESAEGPAWIRGDLVRLGDLPPP